MANEVVLRFVSRERNHFERRSVEMSTVTLTTSLVIPAYNESLRLAAGFERFARYSRRWTPTRSR